MRMGRFDWLSRSLRPQQQAKRTNNIRERREPRKEKHWQSPSFEPVVSAHTRGEARARLKAALGLKRLPPGTVLHCIRDPNRTPEEAA